MVHVRHALPEDAEPLSGVLARSFHDDPQMSFLLPDGATRTEDTSTMFGALSAAGVRRGHTFVLDDAGTAIGGAIWTPPGVESFDRSDLASFVQRIAIRYGDDGLARLGAIGEALAAHHPAEPHFYLLIAGIEPAHQGRTLGVVMLAPTLEHCDRTHTPAYLESSNPRNVSFYERLGFRTVSEFHAEGGPLFTGMWREPLDRADADH